jgi:hypothetical protein
MQHDCCLGHTINSAHFMERNSMELFVQFDWNPDQFLIGR